MNKRLAQAAMAAMTDPSIEARPGFCSRFVRQIVAQIYEDRYRPLFKSSAVESGRAFLAAGLAQPTGKIGPIEAGDILFKMSGSGGFGHVGIYVGDSRVASNSSTKIGRVHGAKGFRTIAQFGPFTVVGRISEDGPRAAARSAAQPAGRAGAAPPASRAAPAGQAPSGTYRLLYHGHDIAVLPVQDSLALCSARDWANAFDLELAWDAARKQVLMDGEALTLDVVLKAGRSYFRIRDLAEHFHRPFTLDAAQRTIAIGDPASTPSASTPSAPAPSAPPPSAPAH